MENGWKIADPAEHSELFTHRLHTSSLAQVLNYLRDRYGLTIRQLLQQALPLFRFI